MARLTSVGIFGSKTRSNALLTIYLLQETHASEVARVLEISLSQAQKAIDSLERAGMIVGIEEGRARRVRLNTRIFGLKELTALLAKLSEQEVGLQERLAEVRRRPRRASKKI